MRNSIKYLASAALAMLVFFSANSTYAQRGGRGGGGGGGYHSGGGGGFEGGGSFGGRSGGSFNGGERGGYQSGQRSSQGQFNNSQRVNSAPQSYSRDSRSSSSYGLRGGQQRVYGGSMRNSGTSARAYGYSGRAGVYNHGGYRSTYRNFYGGYYNRFYAPQLGFRLNILPYGYYPFYWGEDQFYYNNGLFYQQYDNSQYEVVAPPMGAIVPTVPNDAKSITIDGIEYYELNGVYYQPVTTSDNTTGYKIVGKDGELNTDKGGDDVYPQDDNGNQSN